MKLRECLEFGADMGLTDVGEAYLNIENHAIQIFDYSKMSDEMNEITHEYNELYHNGLLSADMLIEDALKIEGLK